MIKATKAKMSLRLHGRGPKARPLCLLAISLAATSCAGYATSDDPDDPGDILSGAAALSVGQNQGAFLTLLQGALPSDEAQRQQDTCASNTAPSPCGPTGSSYYTTVGVDPNGGKTMGTIASALPTLTAFKTFYGFPAGEQQTQYYNRGDLGIGRDMHCRDATNTTSKYIACYVRNFAAGDDDSEFTFGESVNIAFANMDSRPPFATVAMVYRDGMPAGTANRVFFAVYGRDENLAKAAALDRHGITFANEFAHNPNPDSGFGTPGVTFNNHIPSNCITCHGGQGYNVSTHSVTGALFLPFDLDQFEYAPGKARGDQLIQFRAQNDMVRKVAVGSGAGGTSIKQQLDTWYPDSTENFASDAVVSGWMGQPGIYQAVVRPMCRNCHISNQKGHTFDVPFTDSEANSAAAFICGYGMPHALQSLRQFWLSTAPSSLATYFTNVGQGGAGSTIQGCGPGNVATLDPPQIAAALITQL